jgi:hypothetical protein
MVIFSGEKGRALSHIATPLQTASNDAPFGA